MGELSLLEAPITWKGSCKALAFWRIWLQLQSVHTLLACAMHILAVVPQNSLPCRHGWHMHESLHRLQGDAVSDIAQNWWIVHVLMASRIVDSTILKEKGLSVNLLEHRHMETCRRRAGILTGDLLGVLDSWPEEKRAIGLKAIEEVEAEVISFSLGSVALSFVNGIWHMDFYEFTAASKCDPTSR